jgi:hypothetical protein
LDIQVTFFHELLFLHSLTNSLTSNWEKVIGCMADVRIDTTINSVLSNDVLTYKFQASADSRVARGHLLAYSLTYLLTYLLTHLLTHLLTYSLTHLPRYDWIAM